MKHALRNMAVATTLIFTLNATAIAVEAIGKVQQKNSLTRIQTESQAVEAKIELLDNEIGYNMAKTKENKIIILQTEKLIISATEGIVKVEKEAQKGQELYDSRMRAMYINGLDGYTSILLDAESFGDFISRVENLRIIIEFDKKVMDEFEVIKNELYEKQQGLNSKKIALVKLQEQNKVKLDKIILAKEAQKKLITELNAKEDNLVSKINTSTVVANNSVTKTNEMKKTAVKVNYTLSRGANLSQGSVVSYAYNFIGTPYSWGGSSPSTGFDCSGFTKYVYSHFGVSLGRSTYNQINNGVQVSKEDLQPGDLLFFGSNNDPQHTGIYVGGNSYIHSPRTGDVVKVSPMTRGDFITARRVN